MIQLLSHECCNYCQLQGKISFVLFVQAKMMNVASSDPKNKSN